MMPFGSRRRLSAVLVLTSAFLYQWWLKELLFVTLGIGRVLEPIDRFPYKCRILEHSQLESCGDLWLDEENRVLYAACAGLASRNAWSPRWVKQPT